MSKALTKKQIERRKKKAARKQAMRDQYAKWAAEGHNDKSKRHQLRQRRQARPVRTVSHPLGPCGNVGCARCSPSATPRGNTRRAWLESQRNGTVVRLGPGRYEIRLPKAA